MSKNKKLKFGKHLKIDIRWNQMKQMASCNAVQQSVNHPKIYRCPKIHSKEKSTHFMLYPVADYSLLLAGSKGFLLCKGDLECLRCPKSKWTSSVCPPLSSELTPEPQNVQLQLKRKSIHEFSIEKQAHVGEAKRVYSFRACFSWHRRLDVNSPPTVPLTASATAPARGRPTRSPFVLLLFYFCSTFVLLLLCKSIWCLWFF